MHQAKAAPDGAGDVWTFTAIDADAKLILSYLVVGDASLSRPGLRPPSNPASQPFTRSGSTASSAAMRSPVTGSSCSRSAALSSVTSSARSRARDLDRDTTVPPTHSVRIGPVRRVGACVYPWSIGVAVRRFRPDTGLARHGACRCNEVFSPHARTSRVRLPRSFRGAACGVASGRGVRVPRRAVSCGTGRARRPRGLRGGAFAATDSPGLPSRSAGTEKARPGAGRSCPHGGCPSGAGRVRTPSGPFHAVRGGAACRHPPLSHRERGRG